MHRLPVKAADPLSTPAIALAQKVFPRKRSRQLCTLVVLISMLALTISSYLHSCWPVEKVQWQIIGTVGNATTQRIPRIIHQTFSNSRIFSEYRSYIDGCVRLNPDWQYFLWRDEDIVAFIKDHFPFFMQKYLSFKMHVQRADSIRYMVLHHYGGIYIDMDIECVKPFNPSLSNLTAFVDQEAKEHAVILYSKEFSAMNSVMGSVRGHPFFLRLVFAMMEVPDSQGGAGATTGPDLLTDQLIRWNRDEATRLHPVTLLDPVVFSPIIDTTAHDFKELCRKIYLEAANQQPNDRAAHAMKLMQALTCRQYAQRSWKSDLTSSKTVGRHLFLHLGYRWGFRLPRSFDIKEVVKRMKVYSRHRSTMTFG